MNCISNAIKLKQQYGTPYYALRKDVTNITTDMDHFPYKRFYRGVYYKDEPIVFDRKAGYKVKHNSCYKASYDCISDKPDLCFEVPCSTVFPCHVVFDKKEIDVMSNDRKLYFSP